MPHKPTPNGFILPKILEKGILYENPHQKISHVTADFGQFQKNYYVADTGKRSALVVVKRGKILLVSQYRLLINKCSWEIPGGKVDEGEEFEEAAIRECFEETGVLVDDVRPLIFFQPGLDTLNNPTYIFVSKKFQEKSRENVKTKEIEEHVWLPISTCLEMVFNQQIVDSLTVIGILALQIPRTERVLEEKDSINMPISSKKGENP